MPTVGKNARCPEGFEQAIALEAILRGPLEFGEPETHPGTVEFGDQLGEHVGGRHVDLGHGFGRDDDPAGRRRGLGDRRLDLLAEQLRVGEEQRRIPAEQDESFDPKGFGMSRDIVIALHPLDPPEDRGVRTPGPPDDGGQCQGDREEDAGYHADEGHAQETHDRERELRRAQPPQTDQPVDVDERQAGDHDDGGQGGLRQVRGQAGQEHQERGDRERSGGPGQLGLGPGLGRHGCP